MWRKRSSRPWQERFEIQGHAIHISPSIGIGIYPDDGHDIETLLKNADVAMYQAKSAGRNNYQFFTHEMNETALVHLAFEHSLRRALDNGEFVLQYQPQVAVANGSMIGVEALIRWHHPDRGIAAPAQFVPIAEESGLIVPIGAWILREVCTQAAAWRNAFGRSLRVSVNVSPLQFRQRDFVDLVSEVLLDTGIDPDSSGTRVHRSGAHSRCRRRRGEAAHPARRRGDVEHRRFWYRLLVPVLPQALPHRPTQDRSVLRSGHRP